MVVTQEDLWHFPIVHVCVDLQSQRFIGKLSPERQIAFPKGVRSFADDLAEHGIPTVVVAYDLPGTPRVCTQGIVPFERIEGTEPENVGVYFHRNGKRLCCTQGRKVWTEEAFCQAFEFDLFVPHPHEPVAVKNTNGALADSDQGKRSALAQILRLWRPEILLYSGMNASCCVPATARQGDLAFPWIHQIGVYDRMADEGVGAYNDSRPDYHRFLFRRQTQAVRGIECKTAAEVLTMREVRNRKPLDTVAVTRSLRRGIRSPDKKVIPIVSVLPYPLDPASNKRFQCFVSANLCCEAETPRLRAAGATP